MKSPLLAMTQTQYNFECNVGDIQRIHLTVRRLVCVWLWRVRLIAKHIFSAATGNQNLRSSVHTTWSEA